MADEKNTGLHLTKENFSISREHKETLNGHSSFVIWLTGLSASGKSTIARKLEEKLFSVGLRTAILDGDNTRMGINKDLDFSSQGRTENIRRVAEISRLMNDAGLIVIACFISPLRTDRQMAREIIGGENFIETFVDASLTVCKSRDRKGLYMMAEKGEIKDFTGISSPYEPPLNPDIHIHTDDQTVGSCVNTILHSLAVNNKIDILLSQQATS